jgi:hypothetical protein
MTSNQNLDSFENVNIASEGRFKYIQIRLRYNNEEKTIVRGYKWAEYHGISIFLYSTLFYFFLIHTKFLITN